MAGVFLPNVRKQRQYRHTPHVQHLDDGEMHDRYRFTNDGVAFLEDILKDDIKRDTHRNRALSVRQMVLITLRFLATGAFFNVVGDSMGYHKSTVSRVVTHVTDIICKRMKRFIVWPSGEEKKRVKSGFFTSAGFPHVVGCVDGTHIRIQAPSVDEPAYVNRKGYHSINMQAVCDHEGLFTSVNASWPSSCHDAHVFRTSGLCNRLQRDNQCMEDGVLLGDSGYPLRPFLMTPFMNADTPAKERYQLAHTRTRVCIERTFGRLKRRSHVLHSEIRLSPDKACRIVTACAILHNVAVMFNMPEVDDVDVIQNIDNNVQDDVGTGTATRDFIVNSYF
ncbi:putative nuclease HARBI1 [Mya arenaria]|uniref:putative nuclease HARBI1 n=1 Tax=Mya arenaria TaxID=6604 RepID=UPI0022DFB50C|nr:putative nuclease HARBI1 [Mya arenaria]